MANNGYEAGQEPLEIWISKEQIPLFCDPTAFVIIIGSKIFDLQFQNKLCLHKDPQGLTQTMSGGCRSKGKHRQEHI